MTLPVDLEAAASLATPFLQQAVRAIRAFRAIAALEQWACAYIPL